MRRFQVKSELPSTFKAFRFQQHRWSCGPANLFRKMLMEIVRNKVSPNIVPRNPEKFKPCSFLGWHLTCYYWHCCRKWQSGRRFMSSTTSFWSAKSSRTSWPLRSTVWLSRQPSLSLRSGYQSGAVCTFPQSSPFSIPLELPGKIFFWFYYNPSWIWSTVMLLWWINSSWLIACLVNPRNWTVCRSFHLLFFWILFENVMSLHRTKATLIGLLEAGRANEWVVTEKLGNALKMKSSSKSSAKKSFMRVWDR